MICFPLDNTPYEAKDMGTYLATRTRGVFSSDGNLAVTPGESGLSVSVSPGLAWLKWSDFWGVAALQAQALTLNLDTADGALKRIDAIVCRLDKVNNRAEIVVKKGAPSSAPIVVPPVRDANYDELYIATVLIGAGVISISASAITDQRLNEEYCGLMRDGVTGIPTASLHAQAQQILTELTDALNAQIVRQSAEFDAWFEELKGKLGEDPATALQLQVDNLNAAVVGDAFQASGTPVSIAYAGANRIASITAYGDTPQGGATEAPVALTGVDSVHVCRRNLFPCVETSGVTNGITKTVNTDGSITLSGTATDRVVIFITNRKSPIVLSKGTYTIGIGATIPDGCAIALGHYHGNKYIGGLMGMSAGKSYKSFQVSNITGVLEGYFEIKSGTTVDLTIYPMLNLGESPLPYEPYQGNVTPLPIPRPLHKVGDVRDVCRTRVKIACDKRVVANGTESWTLSQGAFRLSLSDAIGPGYAYPCYSSHYSAARTNSANVSNWPDKSLQIGEAGGAVFIKDSSYTTVEEFKAHLVDNPLIIYYRSSSYNGTNGLDICLTEYQTGYTEFDGTEPWSWADAYSFVLMMRFFPNHKPSVAPACSHYQGTPNESPQNNQVVINNEGTIAIKDPAWKSVDDAKAYFAAQKAAGTPVQVAWQLATPEVYATDPLDIDNAAGPLTVMTGGELEVRMTELVDSRSPEIVAKMDKATYDADGDGVVDEAEKVSNALTLKNAAGEVVATFDGSEAAILQLTAALVGALGKTEKAADSSKLAGLTPVIDNPGPSNRNSWYFPFTGTNNKDGTRKYYACIYADRATNLSMSLSGTTLTINYS